MSLSASFQIGRSALAAYQAALTITGQNIANVGNPDYARQSGQLESLIGARTPGGVRPGNGVRLAQLRRHFDAALEGRLRDALGAQSRSRVIYDSLTRTEALYNELTDQDISTQLSGFFAQFSNLETAPADSGARNLVLSNAEGLVRSLRRMRSGLARQVEELNDQAAEAARRAGEITAEIAALNPQIARQESDGRSVASALRDRREALLRELGELMDIQVREQENGSVNVYVGSEPLVEFDRSRGPVVETVIEDGLEVASIRFEDTNGSVILHDGKLFGLLQARDRYLRDQFDRLDTLARGLIFEVNRLHGTGAGLVGYETLTSEYGVADPDAALDSDAAGLPFPVQNGTLIVNVRDRNTGQVITRQIEVDLDGIGDNDTTLNDLAAQLDGVPGLSAGVTADGRLSLGAAGGQEFWFSEDSSDVLAALGVGAFFTGYDAGDIAVADTVAGDPRLIAASLSGATTDGGNAARIARLADSHSTSTLLGNRSIQDYHDAIISDLAVEAAAADSDYQAAAAVYEGLYAQRESISGVSLDEEAINLTRFEQAYQAATRYLSVVDELTTEVMSLLR